LNRLIIMGSPRSHGRCAALAELLFDTYIEQYPHDAIFLAPISELTLDFLHKQLPNASAPVPLAEPSAPAHMPLAEANVSAQPSVAPAQIQDVSTQHVPQQPGATQPAQLASTQPVPVTSDPQQLDAYSYLFECSDDMKELYAQLNCADELIIVSPVYFSGAPAEFKVLLDRMQPYYLRNRALGVEKAAYKPAILHIVGEGGDPHGFKPLASEVKSAFSQAGFAVSRVLNWVGCISEDGSILHDPCDIDDVLFDDELTHKLQSEHGCDCKNKRGFEQVRECECTNEPAGDPTDEPKDEFVDECALAPKHAPASAPAHTRPKLSLSGDTSVHASQRTKRKATSLCSANNARTSSGTKGTARAKNAHRPAKKTHALSASNTPATSRTSRTSKKGKKRG